jgi:imidazolonepropionase-like amidohydrolase
MANAQKNPADLAADKNALATYLRIVRDMYNDGVLLLAGSDGPDPFVIPGFSLHQELEMLSRAGVSNIELLRMATLRASRFLGKSDRMGIVEKGWTADLVLLDANPLESIRNTEKIAGVIVRGRYLPREDLNKILAEVEALAKTE